MKKSRLFLYWVSLVLLMFLYYVIIDSLYSHIQINITAGEMVGVQLTAVFVVPLTLALGFIRFWLLKPVNQRQCLLDIPYFAIPVLIIIACFAAWIWVGIILSVLAGVLIVYEFIRSIIKVESLLLRK